MSFVSPTRKYPVLPMASPHLDHSNCNIFILMFKVLMFNVVVPTLCDYRFSPSWLRQRCTANVFQVNMEQQIVMSLNAKPLLERRTSVHWTVSFPRVEGGVLHVTSNHFVADFGKNCGKRGLNQVIRLDSTNLTNINIYQNHSSQI